MCVLKLFLILISFANELWLERAITIIAQLKVNIICCNTLITDISSHLLNITETGDNCLLRVRICVFFLGLFVCTWLKYLLCAPCEECVVDTA